MSCAALSEVHIQEVQEAFWGPKKLLQSRRLETAFKLPVCRGTSYSTWTHEHSHECSGVSRLDFDSLFTPWDTLLQLVAAVRLLSRLYLMISWGAPHTGQNLSSRTQHVDTINLAELIMH